MLTEDKIILDAICKDIKKGDLVIVALSGGIDSMCLLDIYDKLSGVYAFDIMALHIHHGIREKEADSDLEFVEKYCKMMDIPFAKRYVNAKEYAEKNSLTLEEAARVLRYKEFDNEWKKQFAKRKSGQVYIAVAHHMKDQVETMIHNMLRGTGLRGVAAMTERREYIIRPLLNIKKDEIEAYIQKYDIPYVNDSTNDDITYTRNYIRNEILDKFEKVNNKAISHIYDLSVEARETIEYIELISKYIYAKICEVKSNSEIVVNLKLFRNTSNIVKAGIIRIIIQHLVNTLKDVTRVHIDDVINMAMKEKGGHLDLPYNITVDKKQNEIKFSLNKKNISMSRKKHIGGENGKS